MSAACRPSCIAAGASPGTGLPLLSSRSDCEVADDERLGMPGNRQVWLDQHAPRAVERHAERARQRRGGDAGGPEHGARLDVLFTERTPRGVDLRSRRARRARSRRAGGAKPRPCCERLSGKAGSTRGPASTRTIVASRGSMARKSLTSTVRAMSASAPASSTPVGPPPTITKVMSGSALRVVGLVLGPLEREQHAPPDLERVLERSSMPGASGCPLLVAEVGVADARRRGPDSRIAAARRPRCRRFASRGRRP